jgi:hypothetical protein
MVASMTKISFSPDGNTSPGNYGWDSNIKVNFSEIKYEHGYWIEMAQHRIQHTALTL